MTVEVYDASGDLLRTLSGGLAYAPLASVTAAPQPYNPAQGPLTLTSGSWSFAYDGKDASGADLTDGVYLVEVVSSLGGAGVATARVQVRVAGGQAPVALQAGPNPAPVGGSVTIVWSPSGAQDEVLVYDLAGQIVRRFPEASQPLVWDLDAAGGGRVAPGIYFVGVRVQGRSVPLFLKLAVY